MGDFFGIKELGMGELGGPVVRDGADFAAYEKVWKAAYEKDWGPYEDPFDDKGNITKAAYDCLLQFEKEINDSTNRIKKMKEEKRKKEEEDKHGDTSGITDSKMKKKEEDNKAGPAGFVKKKKKKHGDPGIVAMSISMMRHMRRLRSAAASMDEPPSSSYY